jgi:hypothetical protein
LLIKQFVRREARKTRSDHDPCRSMADPAASLNAPAAINYDPSRKEWDALKMLRVRLS